MVISGAGLWYLGNVARYNNALHVDAHFVRTSELVRYAFQIRGNNELDKRIYFDTLDA